MSRVIEPHQILSRLLPRLWQHISSRRRIQLGLLLPLMTLASFAEIASIGAVLPFLAALTTPERVFEHQFAQPFIEALNLIEPNQLLLPLTIIFAISALFSGAMRLTLLWAQTRLSHAVGSDFSISIYRRSLYQPYAVHVARNSSEVIAGITTKASSLVGNTIMPILTIFSSSFMLITILIALFAIEPTIAFAAFSGFGVIYVLVIFVSKRRLERDSQRISLEQNQVVKAVQEGLGGIRDVLIDGTQAAYCDIYRSADIPLRRAIANIQIISGSPRFGIEALGMVLIATLAFSLAGRSDGITGAIPVLGALALGAQRLLPVLQQAYSNWTTLRGGQISLSDTLDLLDQPLPDYANEALPAPIAFKHNITLSNLDFRYTSDSPWVLQHLEISIPKSSRIGIIGSTGSGKSTLLDIFMGLLRPIGGSLMIDGVEIGAQNSRAWQAHIAHVPQSIFLADRSIAENIAFGVAPNTIDYERVRESACKAQLSETIGNWDKKYDTIVGENGVRLSGGQRQRIGIARALYKKADVIVFDEATSSLDTDTEQAVMEAIENLDNELTIVVVAHRLSSLKNCTRVIELAEGKIVRSGSYQEIVQEAV